MKKILLIIPHYNNPDGLLKSISSIGLTETLDIIIIDDGSSKKFTELDINNNFRAKGKIIYNYFDTNKGIEIALNTGIEYGLENNYDYFARLDCGDLCEKNRFSIQASFLDNNPDIQLLGSSVYACDEHGNVLYVIKHPTKHKDIANYMYINSMFVHPAVMFTVHAVKEIGFYPTKYKAAEDYAYFFKFVKKFKVANLSEVLVRIEINNNGISYTKRRLQLQNRFKIIIENFKFGYFPMYGLAKNAIIYIVPYKVIFSIKKMFFK